MSDQKPPEQVPEAGPELLARLRHQSQRAWISLILATVGGILLLLVVAANLPPSAS